MGGDLAAEHGASAAVTPRAKWAFPAVFGTCLALSIARDPGALGYPVLMVEDARHLFGFYYENRAPASILRFYFGYVSLVPNLVGYLAFFLPTAIVPHLFVLFPLLISSAAFSCFFAVGFRSLVSSDRVRFAICLAMAAAPMGDALLIGNTMYSLWNLLLLLVLLSVLPLSGGPAALALRGGAMSFLACSHPGSVLLLPLWIVRAAYSRSRESLVFHGALITVTLAYLTWGVRPRELGIPDLFEAIGTTGVLVVERVVAVAWAGVHWARAASRSSLGGLLWISMIPTAGLLYGLACATHKPTREQVAQLLAIAYLIAAFSALSGFTREAGAHEIGKHLRYFWIQRELYILLALSSGFLCLQLRGWEFATWARAAPLLALFAGWLGFLNYWDNWRYEVRRTSGYQVESFVATIVAQEKRHGDRSLVRAHLNRGVFSITLGGKEPPKSR